MTTQHMPGPAYSLSEAIVGQGGDRAILMIENATGVAVETFSNGYEPPNEATWAEARGYLRGWESALKQEALLQELVKEPSASPALLEALEKAKAQFLFYEQSHLAKYSADDLEHVRKGIVDVPQGRDAYEKALVNRDMAAMCDAAIASAKGAGES